MQISVLTTVFLLQLMQLSALTTGNTWNSRWCAHLYFNASLGAVAPVRRLIFNLTPQKIWRWLLILRRCVRRQRLFCPVLTWSYAALCFKWPAVMLHEAEYCIEIQDSCSKEYLVKLAFFPKDLRTILMQLSRQAFTHFFNNPLEKSAT